MYAYTISPPPKKYEINLQICLIRNIITFVTEHFRFIFSRSRIYVQLISEIILRVFTRNFAIYLSKSHISQKKTQNIPEVRK